MSVPDGLLAEIAFPPEWLALHRWLFTEIVTVLKHENGDRIFVAGGVLTSGTNLIGIVAQNSQRQNVARSGPDTGWSIEERIDPRMPKHCRSIWTGVVEALIHAKRAAAAERGGIPGRGGSHA